MNDAWKTFVAALKGNQDLLALVGVGLLIVIAVALKVPLSDALGIGLFLGLLWLLFRFALSSLHAKEELREFKKDARVEAVKALAKHVPKGDIRSTIETLMKDMDK